MATVRGLLAELSKLDPDTKIYLAADPEGNTIYEMDAISDDPEEKVVTLRPAARSRCRSPCAKSREPRPRS